MMQDVDLLISQFTSRKTYFEFELIHARDICLVPMPLFSTQLF